MSFAHVTAAFAATFSVLWTFSAYITGVSDWVLLSGIALLSGPLTIAIIFASVVCVLWLEEL